MTGKQLGPRTGEAKDFKTFDQLWEAYTKQIDHFLDIKVRGSNVIEFPEKGADIHGPTAVIRSCAKMDHLKTGGTLLNQKFTPEVVAGEAGLDHMAAQKNPEEYRDLIVRVAGYSDYFRNLDKPLQDEIIERTEKIISIGLTENSAVLAALFPVPIRCALIFFHNFKTRNLLILLTGYILFLILIIVAFNNK